MSETPGPPLALLAELTHRCPLRCPYCSNPLELARARDELDGAAWRRVLGEAAALGVLHVHFSGGEPMARRDLMELVGHAARLGLYTNLITSGVLLDQARMAALAGAGLDHVQISFQDAAAAGGDPIGGYAGGHARKLAAARLVRKAGLPLTVNMVVHRRNLANLEAQIALALELGAQRLEIAHVQYHGWALRNRAALMPSRAQLARANAVVAEARARLQGRLVIDYVVPDYHARRPKACMGGWGRQFLCVTPAGRVLPCHAAETITGLRFDSVRDRGLAEIWRDSEAFRRFRGEDWMPEPCRSCDRRRVDWGGCRCQAFALTGRADATDPVCALSPLRASLVEPALREAEAAPPPLAYRGAPAA